MELYNQVSLGEERIDFPPDITWDDKERINQAIIAAKKDLSQADLWQNSANPSRASSRPFNRSQ